MYDKAEALQNLRACLHQAKERAKAKDRRTIKNIKEQAINIQKVLLINLSLLLSVNRPYTAYPPKNHKLHRTLRANQKKKKSIF